MPLRHLFIDSRFRTSGTDNDFTVNLTENVNLPLGARCFIASVSFPNVFYTLERGVNNRLYMAIQHNGITGGYVFPMLDGNYGGEQLAVEISKWLKVIDMGCQVTYIKSQGRVQIVMSPDYNNKIISDEELVDPNVLAIWQSYTPTEVYVQKTRGA